MEKLLSRMGSSPSVCVILATYTGLGPSWSAWVEPEPEPDHGWYQQVSLLTDLPSQPFVFLVRSVLRTEKMSLGPLSYVPLVYGIGPLLNILEG